MLYKKRNITDKIKRKLLSDEKIVITGPVQAGKTTIINTLMDEGLSAEYFSAEEFITLNREINKSSVILDEVEMIREYRNELLKGKKVISILSKKVKGAIEVYPFSAGEVNGYSERFLKILSDEELPETASDSNTDILELMLKGGYQEVYRVWDDELRGQWFDSYLNNLIYNIRQVSGIDRTVLPSLINFLSRFAAGRLNILDISRLSDIPNTTLRRYINTLEDIYLVRKIKPLKIRNSVKTDKLIFTDTGLLNHILGLKTTQMIKGSILFRNILRNFITMEIIKQLSLPDEPAEIYYFSTPTGEEADIIIKKNGMYSAVSINPFPAIRQKELKAMQILKQELGDSFHRGIILYGGNEIQNPEEKISGMHYMNAIV